MDPTYYELTGMYIAQPTSSVSKSIYRAKNYRTQVNDQHTNVGSTENSFHARRLDYLANFDNDVVFTPIVAIAPEQLVDAEQRVLAAVNAHYRRVGRARKWFETADHQRVIGIILSTLAESGIDYRRLG